jgi:hypothetical protein
MLSETLDFELEDLSTLQRKLLIEFLQRRYPQYWSKFASHVYSWQSQKESLEEFIQNHSRELVWELADSSLENGFRTARRRRIHV